MLTRLARRLRDAHRRVADLPAAGSRTGNSPILVALLRKMSPKRAEMTTRKPYCCSAQTACSRDEPVPKSGPATRMLAPSRAGSFRTNDGSSRQAANRPFSKPVRLTCLSQTAGMIWSVSTLLRRSGRARPVCVVNASMTNDSLTI